MVKTIFVNGNLLVKTQYFMPIDIGVGYETPPEGAIILDPKDEVDGYKCLLIDDDHPQSLFYEYYVKGDVNTDVIGTSYLSASYIDCLREYSRRINEVREIIYEVEEWDSDRRPLVYKMAYVSVLTALDAFICYIVLKRSVEDEDRFQRLMSQLGTKRKREDWQKLIGNNQIGAWEQDAIRYIQETSFLNVEKIDNAIKRVGLLRLNYDRETMLSYFRIRHLIIHRNGKQRNDVEIEVTHDTLGKLIEATHSLVAAIMFSVDQTVQKEMENEAPLPDLDTIFPEGVVRIPFKLSDLARLLNDGDSDEPSKDLMLRFL